MITSEERKGPTSMGGDREIIYYKGADGEPADKEVAVEAEAIEFKGDKEVGRRYMKRA